MSSPFNPMRVVVPDTNRLTFSVMAKAGEEFECLAEEDRAEMTLTINPRDGAALGDLFRGLAANYEFGNNPIQIPLRGQVEMNRGCPFASVLSVDAGKPVIVRRRSWPRDRYCTYRNTVERGLVILCWDTNPLAEDKVPEPGRFVLSGIDMSANDWQLVDNPNVVAVDDDSDIDSLESG
jgi:hypothetical protein